MVLARGYYTFPFSVAFVISLAPRRVFFFFFSATRKYFVAAARTSERSLNHLNILMEKAPVSHFFPSTSIIHTCDPKFIFHPGTDPTLPSDRFCISTKVFCNRRACLIETRVNSTTMIRSTGSLSTIEN